ncbi:phosphate acetyltransferase [Helicobacter monodelphidis]|uniref:phosphate acetyltransferase n=1 Tax=Helicobacter sp. 15-1451 TaxID=2004995 RepID=UPI000DCF33C8|nr:phosphate acetyltransferase [Helicobacter sp. 15-1451]RAX58162.1 phosphate acetyltransferase [Helicobacter sp. 15-1451]
MSFIEGVKNKVRVKKSSIVLAEGSEPRTLEAAEKILQEGFADIILLGNEDEIKKVRNIEKVKIVNPKNSVYREEFIKLLVQVRGHKGVDEKKAQELLDDPLYFGAAMVKSGKADGMVAGAINSTANVLRSALQVVGSAQGCKIVSSFMLMLIPNCPYGLGGNFIFSDPGLVPSPNAEELASIAIASAQNFQSLFGEEPIVAMLSHSTYGSSSHTDALKVVEATKIAKTLAPNLCLDGELQLDAAIIPSVGASKAKGSNVAGKANVLIFPDLDSGNIGYKLVQRLAGAEAIGPITQGLAAPINDLSRGCSADDIVGVVAITALQAQGQA